MQKVFITRKIHPIAKELLKQHFDVSESSQDRPLTHDELIEVAQTYDGILSMLSDPFSRSVLEKTKRLKVLSNYAIGLDNIDQKAAKEFGIGVYNLPDVVTDSTADLTFALFLSLLRKIPEAKAFVVEGMWNAWSPDLFLGEELMGKTFGIACFGRTGRAVAKRALGFGLRLIIWHYRPLDLPPEYRQVSWDELLEESDYISLHVPLKEETRFMIDKAAFAKMKKYPILINMARGAIVHPDDLVTALEKGQVRGAALDVTYPEPISHHHPLCQFANCLIVPHIGSATIECRHRMAKIAAENLIGHFG